MTLFGLFSLFGLLKDQKVTKKVEKSIESFPDATHHPCTVLVQLGHVSFTLIAPVHAIALFMSHNQQVMAPKDCHCHVGHNLKQTSLGVFRPLWLTAKYRLLTQVREKKNKMELTSLGQETQLGVLGTPSASLYTCC